MEMAWLLIGIIVVTGSFLLPGTDDVWRSLDAAGIAAGLYLISLTGFATRKPIPRGSRMALWCLLAVTGTGIVLCWSGASKSSSSQKENLLRTHGSISRTIMVDEMPSILLKVLETYYRQSRRGGRPIGQIFRASYPAGSPGSNIHAPFNPDDSLMIYVSAASDKEIRLVGQEMYVKGRNPEFRNYNGRVGMVQAKAILTDEGVGYESEN